MNIDEKVCMNKRIVVWLIFVLLVVSPMLAAALPFNDDMVLDQFQRNQVMRPLPEGAVPLSAPEHAIKDRMAGQDLQNPIKSSENSVMRGEQLFRANCSACHGTYNGGDHKLGVVGGYLPIPGPDLRQGVYAGRSDGFIWGTIRFGSAIMPRLGWKFTEDEHWHLVNYIRHVQGK